MNNALCFVGAVIVLGLVLLASAIRIVPEYERLVVFRLGRCNGYRGPGLVLLLPVLERGVRVDLREQKREINGHQVVAKDSSPVAIDYVWYFRVVDPVESVLRVGNFETAAQEVVLASFRRAASEVDSRDVTSQFENIRGKVQASLEVATQQWGVKVTGLEIRTIAVDARQAEMAKARFIAGTTGEAQSPVFTSGTVLIDGQSWDAMSGYPIAPKARVRVKRVVLEVEEISTT